MPELLKINIKPIVDDESNKTKAKKTLDKFFKAPYIKKFSPIMKNMLGMDSAYGKHSSMVTPNSSMAAMARSNTAYASPNYMGFDRRSALGEYSSMVLTNSVIQAATDILADDSSVKFVTGDTIQVLTEDNTIKEELDHLFFDVLNVNFNLRDWIRDMIVFGDNFLLLDLTLYEGVCGALPLNIYEVERVEDLMDLENPVKFILNNQADRVFNVWEVAHFRMLGDKQYYPYGSSVLEPVRRYYRQLCLKYNTNILMKNGYKQIKDVVVGDEIYSYNIATNSLDVDKVKNIKCNGIKDIYKIEAYDVKLYATSNHPILVRQIDGKILYKNVINLAINSDELIYIGKDDIKYIMINDVTIDSAEEVWDLEVESTNHNFVAENVVVHNCMIEDAIMIHQIVRAPERRIVYLDVAGLPPESVEDYVNDMANTMKNSTVDMNNDNNLDWKLDPMNMLDDYIIPVRGKDSATKIETLQGAKYEMSLDSVKYIQRNLVTSLKVPKRYLGLDGDSDGKSDLKNAAAQEDIRFSRTIERIQSMVITVLKQIGVTHLILKGYSDSQVDCFNIQMKNPSSASEIEKLEVIKQKFGMAADILEGKLASRRWVYENILNFTKEDIEIIRVELFDDYNFMAKVDAVSNVWLKKFTQEYEKAYNVQTPQDAMGGGAGQQPGEDNKNIAEEFRKKSIGGDNNVGSRLMSPVQSSPILRPYEGKLAKFDKIDKNNTVVNNRLLNEGMFTKFLETNDKLLEEAEEFLNNNPDIDLVELTK